MGGLTVIEAIDTIKHALHGRLPSSELSAVALINEAGGLFCNMHPWRFLERYTSSLQFVAGQVYVDLSSDMSEPLSDPVSTTGFGFSMTDLSEIVESRFQGATGRPYLGAYSYPSFTSSAEPGRLRLEVYPTPAANESNALAMYYRARWLDASGDTDYLDVRPEYRALYKQILREYVAGLEHGDVDARLAAVYMGPIAADAKKHDGRQQPRYGRPRGGAINMAKRAVARFTGVWPPARSIS
jgi:hypothetical protein